MTACQYRVNPMHVCTDNQGQHLRPGATCYHHARAELKAMEARGVNQREPRITGTLESGEPVTVVVQVPRNFNWETPGD